MSKIYKGVYARKSRRRTLNNKEKTKIRKAWRDGQDLDQISEDFNIIRSVMFKQIQGMSGRVHMEIPTSIGMGHKNATYYTEEQLIQGIPNYDHLAEQFKHHELPKGWELYQIIN